MVKALFVYSGTDRRELEKKVLAGTDPDTSFFGFMEVKKDERIEATYIQIGKETYTFAGSFIRKYALLRVLYLYFKFRREFSNYDVIVLMSSAYFDLLLLKKYGLLRGKRWIILNLDLTIALKKREKNPLIYKLFVSKIKEAEKIICISQAQQEFLLARGFDGKKLVFIPLGVDKSFYKKLSPSNEFILTIGRDIGRDFLTFLEAVRLSGKESVMICSPKNVEGLEDKIPPNLEVLFDLPYQELRNYYSKAKVFVIATKSGEHLIGSDCPGQTAILDTLAYGVPVVATYMPWFEGYFESEKHLITVPPENPQALCKALERVASDTELAQRLSNEGRKLIEEKCNSESMGRAIAELILNTA